MKTVLFLTCCILFAAIVQGQTYEIRAVNKGNGIIGVQLQVTMGMPPSTADTLTDLLFGLKWSAAYNVDLEDAITTSFNIKKSGGRTLKGGFHFQSFFADNTPFKLPMGFLLNQWVEIMSVANTRNSTGTGTFEITENGFDPSTNPNIGVQLKDYTPSINGAATMVVLPVVLSQFKVLPEGRMIKLEWAVANELNNKGFEVQRSQKDVANYKTLAWMERKGNTSVNSDYVFYDKDVEANVKYYYRLKQLDQDGQYKFSEVKTAMLNRFDNEAIHLMPNPADDQLQVLLDNSIEKGAVKLTIIDTKGAILLTKSMNTNAGNKTNLDIHQLKSGLYLLKVEDNKGFNQAMPFIKN